MTDQILTDLTKYFLLEIKRFSLTLHHLLFNQNHRSEAHIFTEAFEFSKSGVFTHL